MKQHYLDLTALYESLEPAEKRQLRLHVDDLGPRGKPLQQLLTVLAAAHGKSEQQFLRQAAERLGWKPSATAAARHGLLQTVMQLLMDRQAEQDPLLQVYALLREARSLRHKACVQEAHRRLRLAAALAHTHEENELLAHIQQQLQILAIDLAAENLPAPAPDHHIPDSAAVMAELRLSHEMRGWFAEVAAHVRQRDAGAAHADVLQRAEAEVRLRLRDPDLPFRPKAYALQLWGVLASIHGRGEEALDARHQLHAHYTARPHLIGPWLGPYSGNLYNLVGTLSQMGRWEEAEAVLDQLEELPRRHAAHPSKYILHFIDARTLNLRMLFYWQRDLHARGLDCYAQADLQDRGVSSLREFHLGIHLAAAALYLETWQHQRARAVARMALDQFPPQLRKDLRVVLKVIEVLTLIRDDEGEYIHYKAGNLQRSLRGSKGKLQAWGRLLRASVQLYFAADAAARARLLHEARAEMGTGAAQADFLLRRGWRWVSDTFQR